MSISPLQLWSLEKNTILHKIDPRVKILAIAVVMYVSFLLVNDLFFYIAMHLVAVILVFMAKVSRIMKIYILGFSISTFIGLSIMSGFGISTWTGIENPIILTEFLGYPFFLEGFLWGTVIAFKTTLAFIFAVVLASTTDPSKMLTSLSKIGIPDSLSFGVTVTLRLIPLFMEEYTKISNAIDLRGGKKKGIMGRIRKFRLILEPLLIGALRRSTELGNSIQLRAFGSCKRTHYNDISMKKSDWIITVTILATAALLTYLRFVLGMFSGMGVTYLLPS